MPTTRYASCILSFLARVWPEPLNGLRFPASARGTVFCLFTASARVTVFCLFPASARGMVFCLFPASARVTVFCLFPASARGTVFCLFSSHNGHLFSWTSYACNFRLSIKSKCVYSNASEWCDMFGLTIAELYFILRQHDIPDWRCEVTPCLLRVSCFICSSCNLK